MFPLKDTVRARNIPIVNYLIILLNVLVFFYEATLPDPALQQFMSRYALVPRQLLSSPSLGNLLSLGTSMFMHGGWMHLISNMWALFIFGDNIEDRMGHGRYLLFYLLCGFAAAIMQVIVDPSSTLPMIGASGAISGVMGAYIILFPRSRVLTFIPVIVLPWLVEIPALIYIGFWFISQLFNGFFALASTQIYGTYGGVAYWAHIGGFAAGIQLVYLFAKRRPYRSFNNDEYYPW